MRVPTNLCLKIADRSLCNFILNARAGHQVLYAVIVDVDTKGAFADQSVWVSTVVDYAFLPDVDLIGGVDVGDKVLVPVGGVSTINASEATEVIALFEPMVVIPMHYRVPDLAFKLDSVDKFVKEMGLKKAETLETYKVTKDSLPKETQVVLLEMKQKE